MWVSRLQHKRAGTACTACCPTFCMLGRFLATAFADVPWVALLSLIIITVGVILW